jgi:branched-chain amino acid transport system substrate-binding protein
MKPIRVRTFARATVGMALFSHAALADIKIGINVPLTGFAAADGKSALDGAKLAVAQATTPSPPASAP